MDYKERFLALAKSINRDGIDKLVEFLEKSDFFTTPASTKFHCSIPSGLVIHSLNVYDLFEKKVKSEPYKEILGEISDDSVKIISLFHDICKAYFYATDSKNKKIYDENGSKKETDGRRYDWHSVPFYKVEDKIPYGHGEKSVMMIEEFIKLKPIERYAIRWHMGFSEPKEYWNTLSVALEKYPIILAIHTADLEATYLLEKDMKSE